MVGDVPLAMKIVDEVVKGFTLSDCIAAKFTVITKLIAPQFAEGGESFGFGDLSHDQQEDL
jgi:hypothetical protein